MPAFLLFRDAGQRFALRASSVLGIARNGSVAPLPFAPDYVDGVTVAFDKAVPQQSLRRRLDPGAETGDADRLILVDNGAGGTALSVTAVETMVSRHMVTSSRDHDATVAADLFDGHVRYRGEAYRVLSPEVLTFDPQVDPHDQIEEPAWGIAAARGADDMTVIEDRLIIECAGRTFAIVPQLVKRLADMPTVIHRLEGPPSLLGRSRDDSCMIVSLAKELGNDEAQQPASVVVVVSAGQEIGFAVDAVHGIQPCRHEIDDDDERLYLDDGSAVERLGLQNLARQFERPVETSRAPGLPLAKKRDASTGERMRLLTIRVNETWYGLAADLVRAVGTPLNYAPLPKKLSKFDGFVALYGDTLPAIDLHRVYMAPRKQSGVAAVVSTPEGDIAFMCDALGQVDDVGAGRIETSDQPFVAGRIAGSANTIHLVDTRRILQERRAA